MGIYIKSTMPNTVLIHAIGDNRLIEMPSTFPLTIHNMRDCPVGVRVFDLDALAAKHCLHRDLVGLHNKGKSEFFMNSPHIKSTTLSLFSRRVKYVQHPEYRYRDYESSIPSEHQLLD